MTTGFIGAVANGTLNYSPSTDCKVNITLSSSSTVTAFTINGQMIARTPAATAVYVLQMFLAGGQTYAFASDQGSSWISLSSLES